MNNPIHEEIAMNSGKSSAWGRGLIASIALFLAGMLLAGLATAWPTGSNASPTGTLTMNEQSAAPVVDSDARVPANAWDLYRDEFNAFKNECGDHLDRSSLASPASDDAADFVIKGEGPALTDLNSYRCQIATNPTINDMLIRGLADQKVPSGDTIGNLNPWMGEFVSSSSDNLMSWLEKDSEGNVFVTEEYQKYAFLTWVLLTRLKYEGEQPGLALMHFPLQVTQASGLPWTTKSTDPYQGQFSILAYTKKGNPCAEWVVGINTADGRLAFLENACGKTAPPPKQETPEQDVPEKDRPTPTSDKPTPTPTPTPTPDKPTPTPTPTPKDHSEDPVNNGNSGNGGGKNQDPGPGTYIPPEDMNKPSEDHEVIKEEPTQEPAPAQAPPEVTPPPHKPSEPLPTVDPSGQTNHGEVDPNPTKPEECNPEFMDCP